MFETEPNVSSFERKIIIIIILKSSSDMYIQHLCILWKSFDYGCFTALH